VTSGTVVTVIRRRRISDTYINNNRIISDILLGDSLSDSLGEVISDTKE